MKYVVTVVTVVTQGSHPARGAWIEIILPRRNKRGNQSHPARGAWIEIMPRRSSSTAPRVAPRKGCVD